MKTLVDERLIQETGRFAFRFSCEHCVHFEADEATCAEGYPNQVHLLSALERQRCLWFCKSFELA